MAAQLTKERVSELFDYRDGILIRKMAVKRVPAGPCMSKTVNGYLRTQVDGVGHKVHRLIWILHNGHIPADHMIDHINGVKSDNRIENLRLVTAKQNQYNRRKYAACTSRFKGVSFCDGKYQAMIKKNYKQIRLGYFDSEIDAALAYNAKAVEFFGEHAALNEVPGG